MTPSNVTNISLFEETVFERVNVTDEPFAVNSSTVLSAISKLAATSPINEPNILSDDNTFVEGFRQTPMSKKRIDNIIQDLDEGELLYAASWYRNYCRNKKLIDLTETPQDLRKEIINTFIEQDVWSNKFKTFNYLVTKRCNNLIDSVQEFIE